MAPPSDPKLDLPTPAAKAPALKPGPEVAGAARSRESLWALRKPIPGRLRLPFALALPSLLLCAWILLTRGENPIIGQLFLPSPGSVLRGLSDLFIRDQCQPGGACSVLDSYLLRCIWVSGVRIVISFFFAAAVAIPLGIVMGAFEPVNRFMDPIMAPLRYLPISAFIPLLILWLGIYEAQKIAFLFLGVFVFLLPVVISAIRQVPEELVQTALTLGATRFQVIRTVLLPAALPDIFDSFRVMNAISWTYVILAEFVNAREGLGYLIDLAGKHLKTAEMFSGILVIGVIGLGTDYLIRIANRALFAWREQDQ
ncbi:MAG: ABC transporter permease [Myxococcales bacterium]|nr:ABC transporter permease [Myxococcales bacterium]